MLWRTPSKYSSTSLSRTPEAIMIFLTVLVPSKKSCCIHLPICRSLGSSGQGLSLPSHSSDTVSLVGK
jgi:hypothetical protein